MGLFVFDDFGHGRAARFALKRALVVIQFVGLQSSEPHRHSALFAARVLNFGRVWNVGRLFHSDPVLLLQAGAQERLSVTDACGRLPRPVMGLMLGSGHKKSSVKRPAAIARASEPDWLFSSV